MSNATEWTAAAIRDAIRATGRTKVAISEETGIPYPTLNRKVAGKGDFTLSELLSIADAIGVHPSTFVPPQFAKPHDEQPRSPSMGRPSPQDLLDHEQVCDSCWSLNDAAEHLTGPQDVAALAAGSAAGMSVA